MPDPHSSIYKRPLHGPGRNIRLLKALRPVDEAGNCLRYELVDCDLEAPTEYTALSYVWGDPNDTILIEVNGVELNVTRNLHAALVQLRGSEPQETMLWADAVCINQKDIQERESQVKMMGDIYGSASRVLVWTGASEADGATALVELKRLGALAKSMGLTTLWGYSRDDSDTAELQKKDEFLLTTLNTMNGAGLGIWIPLLRFFQRPWWNRVWVIQETALAKEAEILCGPDRIKWSDVMAVLTLFALAYFRYEFLDIQPFAFRSVIHNCMVAINRRTQSQFSAWGVAQGQTQPVPLQYLLAVHLLSNLDEMDATDPRDKVYALLGMADHEDKDQITVRYDDQWTCRDTYTQAAKVLLGTQGDVNILQYAEKMGDPLQNELPSWVPDWREKCLYAHLAPSFGDQIQMPNNDTTALKFESNIYYTNALKVDVIKGLSSTTNLSWTSASVISPDEQMEYGRKLRVWIKEIESLLQSSGPLNPRTSSSTADAIWRLPALASLGNTPSTEQEKALEAFKNTFGEPPSPQAAGPGDQTSSTISDFVPYFDLIKIKGRRALITESGFLGICTQFARPGDHICILNGYPLVFVVRRGGDGCDHLIGQAYLYGAKALEDEIPRLPVERYALH